MLPEAANHHPEDRVQGGGGEDDAGNDANNNQSGGGKSAPDSQENTAAAGASEEMKRLRCPFNAFSPEDYRLKTDKKFGPCEAPGYINMQHLK